MRTKTKSIMKNTTEIKDKWNELKGKLKQQYATLTYNDLLMNEAKRDELLGRIQTKFGKTKQEIQKIISEL